MENIIILLILSLMAGGIIFYLVRQKKKGGKCIGCPYCKSCKGSCQVSPPSSEMIKK